MIKDMKRMRSERGFTLIELLVVIVILGILAAVVVFAVNGLQDKGQTSSCKIDARTLKTAEEASFAQDGFYRTEALLATDGFIDEVSTFNDIDFTGATQDGTTGHYDKYAGVEPQAGSKCDV